MTRLGARSLLCSAFAVAYGAAGCAPTRCAVAEGNTEGVKLPLCMVRDVPLPGHASRFDYEDIDAVHRLLVVAHMGDSTVDIIGLDHDDVRKTIDGVGTARGVLAAPEVNRIFASASATDELVIIDATALTEVARVATGRGPDGIAWDPTSHVVAVSAQHAGAVTLLADDGDGARTDVDVGHDTGNVAFHAGRGHFFAAVTDPDQLVELTPTGAVVDRIDIAGCAGAHGLRFTPDGASALVACEDNATLARVALDGDHAQRTASTSSGPDVLAVDAGLGWLYVAAEGGDPKVFDIGGDRLLELGTEHVGNRAHSVAVDAATHRAYFPLEDGGDGHPVLRIMSPR